MQSTKSRPFNAILFDLGGTLIYFQGKWPEVIQESNEAMLNALKMANISLESQPFLSDFHSRMRKYDAECGPDFIEYTTAYILRELLGEYGYREIPDEFIRSILKARYEVSQRYWQVEEDTLSTLETLRKAGYRLGLISNANDDADVQALVDKAGIRPFFDEIVTSAARGLRKPNPLIFHETLSRLGVEPAHSAMVGDTLGADILGAQNAGLTSIWITRRADVPANQAHRDTIHPDACIERLSELPDLLNNFPFTRR